MNIDSLIPIGVDERKPALLDASGTVRTYGQLRNEQHRLPVNSGLVIIKTANNLDTVSTYVACFLAGITVALVDASLPDDLITALVAAYRPSAVVNHESSLPGFTRGSSVLPLTWQIKTSEYASIHPDLAVMLATSGSTGSPKFVKLSRSAVLSNAISIAEGLRIRDDQRAITSLPFSYTYGLSVINSHLAVGASVSLTESAIVTKEFWDLARVQKVSTIAGVPTTYRMLRQMRWDPSDMPYLEYLTQAGGRLPDADRQYFLDLTSRLGKDFIVMYGQTEATARITIAPSELLREHISTAGCVIPGGELAVNLEHGETDGVVLYRGPNVMMGYAESEHDLTTPDTMHGSLETGDLGHLVDGALFLTGRSKRIVKAFGIRVSLDDVDSWLQRRGNAVAVQGDDTIEIFTQSHELSPQELRRELTSYLGLPISGVRVTELDQIPLLSNGKVNYIALREARNL